MCALVTEGGLWRRRNIVGFPARRGRWVRWLRKSDPWWVSLGACALLMAPLAMLIMLLG
jgi:hypothetical protein